MVLSIGGGTGGNAWA